MLCAVHLDAVATRIHIGTKKDFSELLINEEIEKADFSNLENAPVVVKGCGEDIAPSAYAKLSIKLKPIVRSLMFGEPCSTVPVYKKSRN
jgi:hypothetical protein